MVRLCGRRKSHIETVFRAETGKELKVGLVNGLMGTGVITCMTEEFIELEIKLNQNPPVSARLNLIIALPRPKSLKKVIEAATSLGIKSIYIIESWRVEKSYWSSPVLTEENLNEHIYLGLEQARDTIMPQIEIRRRFKPFVEDELPMLIEGTRALVAHPYNAKMCPYHISDPITLAIGPEGGFIPYEIEMFEHLGFERVTTGDRILRVEYAIASLAGRLLPSL